MDLLDLMIVVIVILGGWNGYRIGLIRQVTRLFGAVIAYFLAIWLRPYVAPAIASMNLFPKQNGIVNLFLGNLNNAIAFGVVFVIAFIFLRYGAGLLDTLFQLPVLSTVNRLAGLVAGLVFAVVFIYIGSLLAHYVHNPTVQSQLEGSSIVRWLDGQNAAQILKDYRAK